MSLLLFIIFSIIIFYIFFEVVRRVKNYDFFKIIMIAFLGSRYLNIVEHEKKSVVLKQLNLEMSDSLFWFSLVMLVLYILVGGYYFNKNRKNQ